MRHDSWWRAQWFANRDVLLDEWIREHPGARPYAWWRFSMPEPRRQLGGCGALMTERFKNLQPEFYCGVPLFDSIDAEHPPLFESVPAYLDRLGLLQAGENRRLGAWAFEAETVTLDDEPEVA